MTPHDNLDGPRVTTDGANAGLSDRIARAALLVENFYEFEPGSDARATLFNQLAIVLAPFEISARSEPATALAAFLARRRVEDGERLGNAVAGLVASPPDMLAFGPSCRLVEALASADVADENVAFGALQRLIRFGRQGLRLDRALVAVCSILAHHGFDALTSMLERLAAAGLRSRAASFAALRGTASWEPTALGAAFMLAREDLAITPDEDAVDEIRFQVLDLAARAGTLTVLRAIARLPPSGFPALVQAAFSGNDAPFRLVRKYSEDDFENQEVVVRSASSAFRLEELGINSGGPRWVREVMLHSGAAPIQAGTRSRAVELVDLTSRLAGLAPADATADATAVGVAVETRFATSVRMRLDSPELAAA